MADGVTVGPRGTDQSRAGSRSPARWVEPTESALLYNEQRALPAVWQLSLAVERKQDVQTASSNSLEALSEKSCIKPPGFRPFVASAECVRSVGSE